jgi:hypothetical protein
MHYFGRRRSAPPMKSVATRKAFLPLLLPLALAGCGRGAAAEDPFADSIATAMETECLRIASTAKVQRLCTCTGQGIRTSGMKAQDGDARNDEKIHAIQQACRQQVYGSAA